MRASASPQRDSARRSAAAIVASSASTLYAPGRQCGEQHAERRLLAVEEQVHPVAAEQLARELPVLAQLRVADRLDRVAPLGMPAGGEPVQPRDLARRLAAQLEPQQVAEQVVVAEPRARDVDRDDERVGLLELVQQTRTVVTAREEVGERAVDTLEDARAQQQRPDLGRLARQHLAEQVVRDRPLAAGELGDEAIGGVVAGERHRGQPQARRPALGAPVQAPDVAGGDAHPRRRHQLAGLLRGEVQVGAADLHQRAREPQPVQAELRVAPAQHERAQLRRRAGEQLLEPAQRRLRAQLVEVVEDQRDRAREPAESFAQPLQELLLPPQRGRHERGERVVGRDRAGAAQRVHDRGPEARRVGLVALDAHPRDRELRAAQPRRQQHGLAAPGRSADQRDGRRRAAVEEGEQPRALDETCDRGARRRRGGHVSVCWEHRQP